MLDNKSLLEHLDSAINWIKEYVENSKAAGVVIGNSGGKDSAVVIAMSAKAIGKEKVLAITMPCTSSKIDLEDAVSVIKRFGVNSLNIDLEDSFNVLKDNINSELSGCNLSEEALINIKPRLRMTTLYAIAQSLNYLVIGTGNLCEAMVRIYYKMGR